MPRGTISFSISDFTIFTLPKPCWDRALGVLSQGEPGSWIGWCGRVGPWGLASACEAPTSGETWGSPSLGCRPSCPGAEVRVRDSLGSRAPWQPGPPAGVGPVPPPPPRTRGKDGDLQPPNPSHYKSFPNCRSLSNLTWWQRCPEVPRPKETWMRPARSYMHARCPESRESCMRQELTDSGHPVSSSEDCSQIHAFIHSFIHTVQCSSSQNVVCGSWGSLRPFQRLPMQLLVQLC